MGRKSSSLIRMSVSTTESDKLSKLVSLSVIQAVSVVSLGLMYILGLYGKELMYFLCFYGKL